MGSTERPQGAADESVLSVYLLPARRKRYRLFSPTQHEALLPAPETAEGTEAASKGGFFHNARATYRRATRSRTAREGTLQEFRHPQRVEVHYPPHLGASEAQEVLRDLLEAEVRKHRRWLVVNSSLLPVGVVLGLVPGPNVWLAYLAWRTLAHYKTKRGAQKALAEVELKFVPAAPLDVLAGVMARRFLLHRRARVREIGNDLGIQDLDRAF